MLETVEQCKDDERRLVITARGKPLQYCSALEIEIRRRRKSFRASISKKAASIAKSAEDDPVAPAPVNELSSVVEQCKDRIAELTELLGGGAEEVTQLRRLLKTKPAVCEIISFMLKRQVASRTAIYTFLYGARPECDQPEIKIVDVQMVSVRRVLAKLRIDVRSGWGDGSWSISNADKAKIRALMKADEPAGPDIAERRRAFWEAW